MLFLKYKTQIRWNFNQQLDWKGNREHDILWTGCLSQLQCFNDGSIKWTQCHNDIRQFLGCSRSLIDRNHKMVRTRSLFLPSLYVLGFLSYAIVMLAYEFNHFLWWYLPHKAYGNVQMIQYTGQAEKHQLLCNFLLIFEYHGNCTGVLSAKRWIVLLKKNWVLIQKSR